MKLPLLLTQYLREHKVLRLPGIGNFYSSGSFNPSDPEADFSATLSFEYAVIKDADESLIEFIKQKTGKMRPLALADLSSYVESGLQLIAIGKPFYIDGIGTVQKTKDGKHDFVPYELAVSNPKMEEYPKEATTMASLSMKQTDKKRSVFGDEKYEPGVNPLQKLVVAALILGGLAIVVFGGYYLYNQTGGPSNLQNVNQEQITDTTMNQRDSIAAPADSAQSIASYTSINPGSYKFILETTTSKKRALRRYNQLKSYMMDIKMETKDSTSFKLYFIIPANPKDTTRIKDSLSRYYVSKVKIEY